MKPGRFILILFILWPASVLAQSSVSRHEVYWHAGVSYLSGPQRLIVGLGSGPGYRYDVTDTLSIASKLEFLVLAGNTVSLSAGAEYAARTGVWRPSLGSFVRMFGGSHLTVIDSDRPELPTVPLMSVDVHLSPLRFRNQRFSTDLLALSLSIGLDQTSWATGFSLTLLAAGIRF